jgi:Restriction endonuclease
MSMRDLVIAAQELRQREFARLAQSITPPIEVFRSMTADEFRNDVALMLERLGHTVITAHADIVTTKAGQKFIVACAMPADKEIKTPALRRLHDTVVSTGATRGIYVTPREFTPAAEHYAAGAPIDLVDGALLMKSMRHSRKGMALPAGYKAMCCQCGDIIQHQLDKAEPLPCRNGHPVVPTIARAALVPFRPEPSDQPPAPGQPKPAHGFRPRKMTVKAQRRRKIATINKRLRASATHPPGPRPRMR